MKKLFKILSLVLSLFVLITVVACSNKGINGSLEVFATSTKITVTAKFDKNTILEEKTTSVTVKLYNEDVSSQLDSKVVDLGEEKVQGSVTFEDLDSDKKFVLKLYVSHGGIQTLVSEVKAETTSSGSSEEKPIEVNTIADFLKIEDDRDAYYKLNADLDFAGQAAVSLCSSSEPFEGVFDGNDHTISNYQVSTGEYAGLFEYVSGGTIKNLKLSNSSISITSNCKYVGALAGYAVNSTISDVTLDGFKLVSPSSGSSTTTSQIGGLFGAISSDKTLSTDVKTSNVNNTKALNINLDLGQVRPSSNYLFYSGAFAGRVSGDTTITNSKATGLVNVKSRSSSGTAYIGGFAGAIESSNLVSDSVSIVSIALVRSANTFEKLCVGGFAGGNGTGQINLKNCVSVGDIEILDEEARASESISIAKTAYIGGVVGLAQSSPKGIKNCYYAKANFGINVKQADANQTTNYVDKCFVSTTIAYVEKTIINKISNVYSHDDCLNVVGMTTEGVDTIHKVAANTAYENVLPEALKAELDSALALRDALNEELKTFTFNSYSYTDLYEAATSYEASENAKFVLIGDSTIVKIENKELSITPNASNVYTAVGVVVNSESNALNAIVHIVSK